MAELFNCLADAAEEQKAKLVYRSVHFPGFDMVKNHPSYEHVGVKMANGDIYGYFNDSKVRIDSKYANEYKIMTDKQVMDRYGKYGIKENSFNNATMSKALKVEAKIWSAPNSYYFIAARPAWEDHNCQNFLGAVVQWYAKTVG